MRTRDLYLKNSAILRSSRVRGFQETESGSLTIFSLFIFLMIIMISGLAIDLMRYENDRVGVQNTLDTAVIAGSSMSQDADTDAELTALVKDYFAKAGYDSDIVTVDPNIEIPAGGTQETARSVNARVDWTMNTAFMNMVGIPELPGLVGGGAREGQQLIEVALVLDISGSMTWGTKLQQMKDAAKEFVTTVIDNNGADRVLISIIPYNHQVYMTPDLMGRMFIDNPLSQVVPPRSEPGAIDSYNYVNTSSRCARFHAADFQTRRVTESANLDMSASFFPFGWSNQTPIERYKWCGSYYAPMFLYQNNETALHEYIDDMSAWGATAIDYGMNWAVGVLDPSFRPIVQGMLADTQNNAGVNLVPNNAAGHPVDYGTPNVFKYIVLMTDGANTTHRDLADKFKSGPTRIWHSQELEDASGNAWGGYLVEMDNGPPSNRWYVPGLPGDTTDDYYMDQSALPADAEQWSYHKLYNEFSTYDAATYFFGNSDADAYDEHYNDAVIDSGGFATSDARLKTICDKAVENKWIEVFTVAFEAPDGGKAALQSCVEKSPGNYFDVAGTQISAAFAAIAAEITKLRLTQ